MNQKQKEKMLGALMWLAIFIIAAIIALVMTPANAMAENSHVGDSINAGIKTFILAPIVILILGFLALCVAAWLRRRKIKRVYRSAIQHGESTNFKRCGCTRRIGGNNPPAGRTLLYGVLYGRTALISCTKCGGTGKVLESTPVIKDVEVSVAPNINCGAR